MEQGTQGLGGGTLNRVEGATWLGTHAKDGGGGGLAVPAMAGQRLCLDGPEGC
jgi:hypothetical protein